MTKKRGPYSSPRQRERRRRILESANEQLEKHGLEALTMQSIAQVSDVSTKTLYNLFGSRDLLLLETALQSLAELEESDTIQRAAPGVPQLLAFTVGTMHQFERMPQGARAVISVLIRADLDYDAASAGFGPVQRFAYQSLCLAADSGELAVGADPLELSYQIAALEWGTVLLWEKGLLQLDQLARQVDLGHHLLLLSVCIGSRRTALEASLEQLMRSSASISHPPVPDPPAHEGEKSHAAGGCVEDST